LFHKMYLSREVEARISVVTQMHYRETALLSVGPCNQVFERTWVRCGGFSRGSDP
jgi:hypothetical protein